MPNFLTYFFKYFKIETYPGESNKNFEEPLLFFRSSREIGEIFPQSFFVKY